MGQQTKLAAEFFAQVWQRSAPDDENNETTLVALFVLDSDAKDWTDEQNEKDPGLYFYNKGKINAI